MVETSIERIQGDNYCCITTGERKFINKLKTLADKHPDQVEIKFINEDGSVLAYVPYDWFRFVKPPRNVSMTNEQREAAKQRMLKAREQKRKD